MAHNLEMIDGEASFFTNREPAWHLLGTIVDGAQTWKQAIKKAKMNWEVVKRKLYDKDTKQFVDAYGIFRSDNGAFLGAVGDRYTPIQNDFQFAFMDKILGEGGAHYEAAGVLGKGERVFVLANLTSQYDIHGTGDIHRGYLAGFGSHDGSSSQRFFTTDVRIVCQNTLSMALNKAGSSGVSVRHTANAESRIMAKADLITQGRDKFMTIMQKLERLAERKVNTKIASQVIADIFKVQDTEDIPTRTQTAITAVQDLFESNDNNMFPQFRGTGYNLLNAITEYTDHFKEVRMTGGRDGLTPEQVRADSAMFGLGAEFKSRALDLILDATKHVRKTSLHKTHSVPLVIPAKAGLN